MSGLSGASVRVFNGKAFKLNRDAPTRVVEQGEWLLENHGTHLPYVVALLPSGYVMEELDPVPLEQVKLDGMVTALRKSVWRWAPRNFVDPAQTLLKVDAILFKYAPELIKPTIASLAYLRKTEDCLTHGDPTAENVMLRDGTYVLIDPIPSTEAVPDDLAVDVGKLLQSAHGWEAMKGEGRASFTPYELASCFTPEVFDVAQLWCIVHFVRTLPYTNEEVRWRVVNKLYELLGV